MTMLSCVNMSFTGTVYTEVKGVAPPEDADISVKAAMPYLQLLLKSDLSPIYSQPRYFLHVKICKMYI